MIALLALACTRDADTADPAATGGPIVVVWTIDTLGATAARQTGWCERLGGALSARGLDLACLEGVSPSSWTGEAHTRVLWPAHQAGDRRQEQAPRCGEDSVQGELGRALRARVLWGSDNPVLRKATRTCDGGDPSWFQDVDVAFPDTTEPDRPLVQLGEDARPAGLAIDALVDAIGRDEPAVAVLNSLEPGGHFPRCWFDPETPACEALWRMAVRERFVGTGEDPAVGWLNPAVYERLTAFLQDPDHEDQRLVEDLYWTTMKEGIEFHRGPRFDDRLARILDAAEAAERLDDLVLVAWGDHGETPCERRPVGDERRLCEHGALPNEFTANVPLFVSPARVAEGWEAAGLVSTARPFSTGNVAYGLLGTFDVDRPGSWPDPTPLGEATSITCRKHDTDRFDGPVGTAVFVRDDVALRCQADDCAATSWAVPEGPHHDFTVLADVPASLSGVDTTFLAPVCAQLEAE